MCVRTVGGACLGTTTRESENAYSMKIDALKQFAKLKQQLIEEKSQLESRLNEINQVLGAETTSTQATQPAAAPSRPGPRRGRRPSGGNTMSMREAVLKALAKGPVARKDLVKAVEGVGYKFNTKNPLNSIGSVLYNKKSGVKSKNGTFYVEGGSIVGNGGMKADQPAPTRKKRRRMSAEGRARIAAAARRRWAKVKAGK
jgi:hypothetical protein